MLLMSFIKRARHNADKHSCFVIPTVVFKTNCKAYVTAEVEHSVTKYLTVTCGQLEKQFCIGIKYNI